MTQTPEPAVPNRGNDSTIRDPEGHTLHLIYGPTDFDGRRIRFAVDTAPPLVMVNGQTYRNDGSGGYAYESNEMTVYDVGTGEEVGTVVSVGPGPTPERRRLAEPEPIDGAALDAAASAEAEVADTPPA